ncbi:MAG: hypothetical protein ABL949_07885 [Fimbriimonadaceae bacterium]
MKRLALFIAVLIVLACGGGGGGTGGGGGGSNNGVTLNVNSANIAFAQTLNLVAQVPGISSQTVTWSVTGGTIAPTGASSATYTSPSTAGTFTITARSVVDTAKFATCVVSVSQVGVSIDPPAVTLGPGRSTVITGTVTGATNTTVNFSASAGSISRINSRQINYTAPTVLGNYTVTASAAANSSKTATCNVTVANVGNNGTVTGQVRREGTTTGVPNATVAFYNSAGAELGRATTGADGRFSASVPITATRFHIITSSITPAYYAQYTYSGLRYTTLVISCSAPLPVLSAGSTTPLPNGVDLNLSSDPPPPPPNGCS